MSVGRFCQEQQITEQSFYVWRKRLRQPEPVRFALVEPGAAPTETAAEAALELMLKTGERLRIGRGVDEAALYRIDRFAGMMHLPGSVRVYLCLTPCDMRNYTPSIDMRSSAVANAELARFQDAGRRITEATTWSEAWPATCPVVGSDHAALSVELQPPSLRVFRWDPL
jgi:hypothetical protein